MTVQEVFILWVLGTRFNTELAVRVLVGDLKRVSGNRLRDGLQMTREFDVTIAVANTASNCRCTS
jgi:hypothetical protein